MEWNNFAHGSLDHAIEHEQVKSSHMDSMSNTNIVYTKGETMWDGMVT